METHSGFDFFDHTADVGIRVFAPTLAGLIQPAGEALYSVIGELAAAGESLPIVFNLTAGHRPGAALLLRDYLAELLVLFERDQRVATLVEVSRFDDERLAVRVQTALLDVGRTIYHREVKAVTYHELEIRRTADGYEATIIVDI